MNLAASTVLVTGGAGFIGSRLAGLLAAEGARITVVDNLSTGSRASLPAGTEVVQMDLPDRLFADLVGGVKFDAVFHLAGPAYVPPSVDHPIEDLRRSAEVTLQVLEAVRRTSPRTPLIYTSSAAVYGNPERQPISETTPPAPVSPYGVSKLAAEHYVSLYARLHGMRTASLRLFSVYGPGQRKQVVFDLIGKVRSSPERIEVHGTGEEVRDFVYVDDVAAALGAVLERGDLRGEAYNVASGGSVAIRDLVSTICSLAGAAPRITFTGRLRPGDALRWTADISRLSALGFVPSTRLEDGVRRVIEWYDRGGSTGHGGSSPPERAWSCLPP